MCFYRPTLDQGSKFTPGVCPQAAHHVSWKRKSSAGPNGSPAGSSPKAVVSSLVIPSRTKKNVSVSAAAGPQTENVTWLNPKGRNSRAASCELLSPLCSNQSMRHDGEANCEKKKLELWIRYNRCNGLVFFLRSRFTETVSVIVKKFENSRHVRVLSGLCQTCPL